MLVDSWAWVEMFERTPLGIAARRAIQGKELHTSVLSVAEVSNWCAREDRDPDEYVDAIKKASTLLFFDAEMAQEAGTKLSHLRKISPGMGMIDALIYAQAVSAGLPLLTGDPHFKNLPGVQFVG